MTDFNNAALLDARRRHGGASRETLENLVQGSNCKRKSKRALTGPSTDTTSIEVDRDEVDRLKKRFMKLDKAWAIKIKAREYVE